MKARAIAATGLLVLGCVAVPASGATASARNCYSKGDLICAPTSAAQQYRAWQTFDPRVFHQGGAVQAVQGDVPGHHAGVERPG